MMVAGVVKTMTAESAERAALGAGAIVMDVLASNDGRLPHEKIERIRHLRPDMILLSGGIDGGTITHVVELAQIIAAADPKARLGAGYKLPVIYAGNKDAADEVAKLLEDKTALYTVDNLRPVLERENLGPARDKIHDLFMEHVMAQAPGYSKLMGWTDAPIMPTPGAVGDIIETIAKRDDIEVVGVDIGGATTDVFSVFEDTFNRTVSANLGMSYSISNVLAEAGIENVMRWVPFDLDELGVRNRIKNKMIRPTTIPQTLEELMLEQAIAREALRLAFEQHKTFAVGLKGVQQERTISDAFEQTASGGTLVNMMDLDLLVGSGGVLSHAPRRQQSAMMLIDAFLPEGVTRLAVDSIFMMPQLGVLAEVHEKAATEVFEKDCLIHLGHAGRAGRGGPGGQALRQGSRPTLPGRHDRERGHPVRRDEGLPARRGRDGEVKVTPARGFDVGCGPGEAARAQALGRRRRPHRRHARQAVQSPDRRERARPETEQVGGRIRRLSDRVGPAVVSARVPDSDPQGTPPDEHEEQQMAHAYTPGLRVVREVHRSKGAAASHQGGGRRREGRSRHCRTPSWRGLTCPATSSW